MACPLANERIWLDKHQYNAAESKYYESLSKLLKGNSTQTPNTNEFPNTSPEESSSTTKKNKKNKNQKNKMNKQSTETDSVSESLPKPATSDVVAAVTATAPKKTKKDKKKSKTLNEDQQISEKEKTTEQIPNNKDVDAPSKTKENKEKKNKADKKKSSAIQEPSTATKGAGNSASSCTGLVSEIAKARQHIKESLERMDGIAALAHSTPGSELLDRLSTVEKENTQLRDTISKLENLVIDLKNRVTKLEGGSVKPAAAPAPAPAKKQEDDDDVDLFGSDEEEDAQAAAIREKRLEEYASKKSKKPALIAKSSIVLDVKCWDDETDMKELEKAVRSIATDGLLWGASKLVPVGYGINKLQISCVVEDEKVSVDWLTEEIESKEDFVQSVDIAAFNKI